MGIQQLPQTNTHCIHLKRSFFNLKPTPDTSITPHHNYTHRKHGSSRRPGHQGPLDRASKAQLENEFGTKSSDDAVQQILEKGSVQESQSKAKTGVTNESNGPGIGGSGSGVHN